MVIMNIEEAKEMEKILNRIDELIEKGKYQSAKELSIVYQNLKCEKIIEKQN